MEESSLENLSEKSLKSSASRLGFRSCPWCGKKPFMRDTGNRMSVLRCENENCPVQPSTVRPMSPNIAKMRWEMTPEVYRKRFLKDAKGFRRSHRWKTMVPKIKDKFEEAKRNRMKKNDT